MYKIDYSPLIITLKTGILTTILAFFLGIGLAWFVLNLPRKLQAFLDGVITLPMILPPTVAGFMLLMIFSLRRPVGAFFKESFNIQVVQTWSACVIASLVISLPLMYRSAKAAFEQVDDQLIQAGRSLGLREGEIFWKIILPLAKPGLISGTILTFARAMGEYGATMMLAGNILGRTRTVSMAIASEVAVGDYRMAGFWVIIIVTLSLFMIVGINIIAGGEQRK